MKMINNTTIVNRMATAGEYLAPGDIILQIPAVTSGPARSSKPVCLGCLKPDSVCKLSPCPKCSWPICSPDCSYIDQHKQECNLLQTSNSECQIENFSDFTNCLDFITPLRLLLKILNERQLLKDVNVNFGDFNRASKEKEDENIVKSIKNLLKSEDELSIKRCVYICEKYGVPIENGCIGIYENIPSLQHSCSPNTYYSLTKNNREIMFRASVNINSGETINFCKTDMMKCNYFRRKQLQEMGIHCSCLRCMDRGEFGTGFGGLKCDSCQGSLNESLDNGKWSCDSCDKSKNGAECRQVLEKLERKVAHMSKEADASRESVLQFESLLKRVGEWSQVPENSQLLFDIKYRLIFIYQYHKDFYHLEEDYLTKKLNYCSEWIAMSEKLYKGRNYARVLIQYEMMNAAVALMQWMKQNYKPTDEVNSFINKIVKMAANPIEMLVDEEDGSFLKAFRDCVQIATEAREEQKRRIILPMWQDDDDEEDW